MRSEKGKKDLDALLLKGVGYRGTAGRGGCTPHKSSSNPSTESTEYLIRDSSANNGLVQRPQAWAIHRLTPVMKKTPRLLVVFAPVRKTKTLAKVKRLADSSVR